KLAEEYPHYPIQVFRLGDQVTWIALGGEVVVDYALRLKKELNPSPQQREEKSSDRKIWVTAYANNVMSYIPSARLLKEGGYEADFSQIYYGFPTKWAPAVEDRIVGKVKELVKD